MTVSPRTLGIAGAVAVAACVASFLVGRGKVRTVTKVETKTEVVEKVVEKVVTVKAKDVQRKVTTKTETKPDGSSVVLRVEDVQTQTDVGTVSDFTGTAVTTSSSKAETATGSKPGWRLGVSAEWKKAQEKPDVYGLEIDRRIVGPFWLGARASTDKTAGIAVGLEW